MEPFILIIMALTGMASDNVAVSMQPATVAEIRFDNFAACQQAREEVTGWGLKSEDGANVIVFATCVPVALKE